MIRRALEAGMRIKGQVAGHEINLEIEDVLDKIKKNKIKQYSLAIWILS